MRASQKDRFASCLQVVLGMDPADAAALTEVYADALGPEGRVEDLDLEQDVRAMFYELEPHRILSFRRTEREHEDGIVRRHFHWYVRWDVVEEVLAPHEQAAAQQDDVYGELPQDAWARVTV